jgi:beta-glucosidase
MRRPLAVVLGCWCAVVAGCQGERDLRFDPRAVAGHRMLEGLDARFLLGVGSSAYQTEGGNHNDWSVWERGQFADGRPHVADGATAERAADAWHLWREDVRAVQELGANMYRVGVEWSRLEPAEGAWDEAAAAHYREVLQALRSARPQAVAPMLNLWHFTLPAWVAARGGWEWPGAPAAFAAFAARVADRFGDLVDWWCTLNEPNVYASAYLSGEWPPEVADPQRAARVMVALLQAHALAAAALRAHDRADADGDGVAARVGLAHAVRLFDPASRLGPLDRLVAGAADEFFNRAVPDAVSSGEIRVHIPRVVDLTVAAPELRGTFDYLGINYYTRDLVSAHVRGMVAPRAGGGRPFEIVPNPGRDRTDMDQEIYPEGLYRVLIRFARYGWPVLVTENGMADRAGTGRPDFIRAHIYALDRARADGVPVIGYLYWSLTDNFEWAHGYRGRYGLYAIDFEHDPTLRRRPTPAVDTFRELAAAIGLRPAPRPSALDGAPGEPLGR